MRPERSADDVCRESARDRARALTKASLGTEKLLLDEEAISRTLSRIAHEIIERTGEVADVALVGIHTRGVPLAQRLRVLVHEFSGVEVAFGTLAGCVESAVAGEVIREPLT